MVRKAVLVLLSCIVVITSITIILHSNRLFHWNFTIKSSTSNCVFHEHYYFRDELIHTPLQIEYEKILNNESSVDKYFAMVAKSIRFQESPTMRKLQTVHPSVFVIGAMKAGTTSLHDLLNEHPQLRGGRVKEFHFYDRIVQSPTYMAYFRQWHPHDDLTKQLTATNTLLLDSTPLYLFCPLSLHRIKWLYNLLLQLPASSSSPSPVVSQEWLKISVNSNASPSLSSPSAVVHQRPSRTSEPSNFTDPEVPQQSNNTVVPSASPSAVASQQRIKTYVNPISPFPRFIIILRDPISRAYSQCYFTMNCSALKFDRWVRNAVSSYQEFEQNFTGLSRDLYGHWFLYSVGKEPEQNFRHHQHPQMINRANGTYVHAWNVLSEYNARLQAWPDTMVLRSMYSLQLRRWLEVYPMKHFHIIETADLARNKVGGTMSAIFNWLGVAPFKVKPKHSNEQKKDEEPMMPSTRAFLEDFFRPYDEDLATLLGRKTYWMRD